MQQYPREIPSLPLLRRRHAADGLPAKKHPSRDQRGVHQLQMVRLAEEHRPGRHPGQSRSRFGSHGLHLLL